MTTTEKRLHYFDGQFLKAADFSAEQAYHIDRHRRHHRLFHTAGIAEGLSVNADEGAREVEVAPGTAVDGSGRQMVIPESRTVKLSEALKGKTVLLVISYHEELADPAETGGGGDTRWLERPQLEAIEESLAPPALSHVRLAQMEIDPKGYVSKHDSQVRTQAGVSLRGEAELEGLTMLRSGVAPGGWPRLTCGAASRADLSGSFGIDGDLTVAGSALGLNISGPLSVTEKATIGSTRQGATLQIVNKQQDANGDTLLLGRDDGPQLRLGYHRDYAWMQSHGSMPLAINPLGNNVGIGTTTPEAQLHVEGGVHARRKAIPLEENECQLEVCAPNSGQPEHYTKIRFHQHNQYQGWFGYHRNVIQKAGKGKMGDVEWDVEPIEINEFTAWDLDSDKAAQLYVGKLRLGEKFLLSGIGDPIADDQWLRLLKPDGTKYWGGFAAKKLWSETGLVLKSDARSKRDIASLGSALEKLLSLRPVRFKWKDESAHPGEDLGLIAQEVEDVFPEVVKRGPDGSTGLSYSGLVAVVIEALKEQHVQILALEERIADAIADSPRRTTLEPEGRT